MSRPKLAFLDNWFMKIGKGEKLKLYAENYNRC